VGRSGRGSPADLRAAVARAVDAHGWLDAHRLPPGDREAVLDVCRLVHLPRHEILLRRGEDATTYLLRGAALVRSITSSGTSTVLRILAPGAAWGWAGALGNVDLNAEVEAVADSTALVIPGAAIRELVRQRPAIAQACLETVAKELAALQDETARFHNTSTTERVVHRLIQLADTWGRHVEGRIEITLRLTQEDLASWARASRESTTKTLQELRSSGVISTGRREIAILDPARLRRRSTIAPDEIDLRDTSETPTHRPGGQGDRRALPLR
jgi:CRP/FNR family transcriptional regulator, cyclic AMP receptor protein